MGCGRERGRRVCDSPPPPSQHPQCLPVISLSSPQSVVLSAEARRCLNVRARGNVLLGQPGRDLARVPAGSSRPTSHQQPGYARRVRLQSLGSFSLTADLTGNTAQVCCLVWPEDSRGHFKDVPGTRQT